MTKKFVNDFEALGFVKKAGAKIVGRVIFIKSGTFGLHTIGVVDFLAKCGYEIVWM